MDKKVLIGLGAGAALLLYLKNRAGNASPGPNQNKLPPPGRTGFSANPTVYKSVGEVFYGDVASAKTGFVTGTESARDVAGDVTDDEIFWTESADPYKNWETFYRHIHLPASLLSPSEIGPDIWKTASYMINGPGRFRADANTDFYIDFTKATTAHQRAPGPQDDIREDWAYINKYGIIIGNIFSFGLGGLVHNAIDDSTQNDPNASILDKMDSALSAGRVDEYHALKNQLAKEMAASLPAGSQYVFPAVWITGDTFEDYDGGYQQWLDKDGNVQVRDADHPLIYQYDSTGIVSNPAPLSLRYGPGGESFYPRFRFFASPGWSPPWSSPALGLGQPTRARVNYIARIYRALDAFSCLAYPYEILMFDNDAGLWFGRRPSNKLYTYNVNGMDLIGSVLPMPSDGVEIPGHSSTSFDRIPKAVNPSIVALQTPTAQKNISADVGEKPLSLSVGTPTALRRHNF